MTDTPFPHYETSQFPPPTAEEKALFERVLAQAGMKIKDTVRNYWKAPEATTSREALNIEGTLILVGGGLSGTSITRIARNNDLLAEEVIERMEPKEYDPTGLYKKMVDEFGLKGKSIVVFSSASQESNDINGEDLDIIFRTLGVAKVHVINTHEPSEIDTPENLAALKIFPYVMMDGGDQDMYRKLMQYSEAKLIMQERLQKDPNFVLAGTSAGAMIVSDLMMDEGKRNQGFAWVPPMIETHLTQRKRHERMRNLLLAEGAMEGMSLGIDEGTAIKLSRGQATFFGSGTTQKEWDSGLTRSKTATIMIKKAGEDGQPMIMDKEYVCKDGKCVLSFSDMKIEVQETVPVLSTPATPLPPVKPKDPIRR